MMLRTITSTAAAAALGAALLAPAAAQAAPATNTETTLTRPVAIHFQDEQGTGVIEPSAGLRQESSFVEHPEGGGTWYHGVKAGKVYSNFYHYTRKHGSSVKDGDGHLTSSPIVSARHVERVSRS